MPSEDDAVVGMLPHSILHLLSQGIGNGPPGGSEAVMSLAARADVVNSFQVQVDIPDPVFQGTRAAEREDDQSVRVVESKEPGDIANSRNTFPS